MSSLSSPQLCFTSPSLAEDDANNIDVCAEALWSLTPASLPDMMLICDDKALNQKEGIDSFSGEWYTTETAGTESYLFDLGLKLISKDREREGLTLIGRAAAAGLLAAIDFLAASAESSDSECSDEHAVEASPLPSQLNALAIRFNCGYGVDKNVEKAKKLWQTAAEAGQADALYWLAVCEEDEATAAHLFSRSAELGHCGASYELGRLLASGALSDPEEALRHFAAAAAPPAGGHHGPYKSMVREAAAKRLSELYEVRATHLTDASWEETHQRARAIVQRVARRERLAGCTDLLFENGRLVEASI